MCAIVDNNVRHEVFGAAPTEAGQYFLDWLERGDGMLALGGRLLRDELSGYQNFNAWLVQALLAGQARRVNDGEVDAATEELKRRGICRSDDEHILALARVSGARLLFTNDRALQRDFRDREIIGGIRGRVYTTVERSDVRPAHRELLRRTDLCQG